MSNEISKIKLPNVETVYEIKDAFAREQIANIPKSMVFKGTLGEGGTVISLPIAGESSLGWTYKVITAGTYAEQVAKVGDLFVCGESDTTPEWILIPSGDEPSGTVTNVATGTGLTGGPITDSGIISLDGTYIADDSHSGLVPTTTADKYLHADENGALEWAELVIPTGVVKYDEAQTLTTAQKEQARANIGAGVAQINYIFEEGD